LAPELTRLISLSIPQKSKMVKNATVRRLILTQAHNITPPNFGDL